MDYEEKPFNGKISPTACLGGRTPRPLCYCCGGAVGVRRAKRKMHRHHEGLSKGQRPKRPR